ncbi:hypothetical protein ABGB18_33360 [Nonomuraea sp. B12E4]
MPRRSPGERSRCWPAPVGRVRWLGGHLLVAAALSATPLVVLALMPPR